MDHAPAARAVPRAAPLRKPVRAGCVHLSTPVVRLVLAACLFQLGRQEGRTLLSSRFWGVVDLAYVAPYS